MASPAVHLVSVAAPFRRGVADLQRPPSGILYVGGHLKRHGFDVRIHHLTEDELEATAQEIVSGGRPQFVGFSLMTGRQIATSARMSSRIRMLDPTIPIVWGGIHPSLMPAECLAYGMVDYVVMGEGEASALDLAQHLTSGRGLPRGMPGVAFLDGGVPSIGPVRPFASDLDEFRQDWSLVEASRYVRRLGPRRAISFITSRGCPHSCGFCYNQQFNRRRWRGHSVDHTVRELLDLQRRLGIDTVSFDDDNFFTNPRRGLEILRRLKERGITCTWLDLRVDDITEDLVREFVSLGVETIFTGWESGSATTLHKIAKGFTPELILEKTRILSRYPTLGVDASAIVGFPWETNRDIDETVSLALKIYRIKQYGVNFNLGIYVPYPGAPVTEEARARGFSFPVDPEGWSQYDILAGTMQLPWMGRKRVLRYTMMDRYAKLLFVPRGTTVVRRAVLRIIGSLAVFRLRTGFLALPLEVRFMDWYAGRRQRRVEARNLPGQT